MVLHYQPDFVHINKCKNHNLTLKSKLYKHLVGDTLKQYPISTMTYKGWKRKVALMGVSVENIFLFFEHDLRINHYCVPNLGIFFFNWSDQMGSYLEFGLQDDLTHVWRGMAEAGEWISIFVPRPL